jgi:hypothetical protein
MKAITGLGRGQFSGLDRLGDEAPESDRRPDVTAEAAAQKFKEKIHGVRLVYDFREQAGCRHRYLGC